MVREIVMDTETTGMDPFTGDRVVEIGAIELINHLPTGNHYHVYINPERDVPAEVVAVHGLTAKFLSDKKTFSEIYTEFLDFIGDAKLVIHNAEFDMKFINHHLQEVGTSPIGRERVVDTLHIARRKFPGSPANLDALCKRFGIDNSNRVLHGALLDSELLAEVYLELLGGRQVGLAFTADRASDTDINCTKEATKPVREARKFPVSDMEINAHAELVTALGEESVWKKTGM